MTPETLSNITELAQRIGAAWERRDTLARDDAALLADVEAALAGLDNGTLRVAEPDGAGSWHVHQWLKQAVLLSFRLRDNAPMQLGLLEGFDKVPLKYTGWTPEQWAAQGARVVPPAAVRRGAFIGRNAILMPSFVNIGAYVGEGTMVDTWATVGSCAQIGKNVHLSGGVGIGGVLEPLQASPTIIEDDCFIGARSEVVEGVVVGAGSVLSMGVFIGQSTPIYDRDSGSITYGRVPPGSVVVPGTLPRHGYALTAAIIVKTVDAKTRAKTGINGLLREAMNDSPAAS